MIKTAKLLLVVLAIVFIEGGCKKDNGDDDGPDPEDTDYFVEFKANGVQQKYTSNALSQVITQASDGLYSCVLQGYGDYPDNADKNLLSMIIWNTEPITTFTYLNNNWVQKADETQVPQVLITYIDAGKNSFLSQKVPSPIPPFDKIVSDVEVKISDLGEKHISGTFSGTLYSVTDATFSTVVEITDGKFNLIKY
ncbi:MAG: hypothetical protein JNK79_12120 [Chitinophagaceae bacterium]|nr:hypothetical protein [Chitinophagaceae bacterium]